MKYEYYCENIKDWIDKNYPNGVSKNGIILTQYGIDNYRMICRCYKCRFNISKHPEFREKNNMFGLIRRIFKIRPKDEGWYLVYGIDDLDRAMDDRGYGYFIAKKSATGEWNSACGKDVVDVSYYESLF